MTLDLLAVPGFDASLPFWSLLPNLSSVSDLAVGDAQIRFGLPSPISF
jgi:hypothetical protein